MKPVNSFRGLYQFLSNMYESPVKIGDLTFRNAEAAFQSMKDPARAAEFTSLTGQAAKRLGRQVQLRPDWNNYRLDAMREVLRSKFSTPELRQQLLSTGDVPLSEGNTWHDTFWGIDATTGKGENNLGKLLMQLRQELSNPTQSQTDGGILMDTPIQDKQSPDARKKLRDFFAAFFAQNPEAAQAAAEATGATAEAAAPAAGAATVGTEAAAKPGAKQSLGAMFGKLKGAAPVQWTMAHPGPAALLAGGGALNVAGLFDNDKVGGQLVGAGAGAGLGALASHLLKRKLGVPGYIGAALLGGGIGSGIDMLRSKRDQARQAYAQNPVMSNGMVQVLPNDNTLYTTPEEFQKLYAQR